MSSPAIATVIKIMESLSENAQNRIAEGLQDHIQDLQDIQECTTFHHKPQDKLMAAINLARQQIESENANLEEIQEKLYVVVRENYLLTVNEFLTKFRQAIARAIAELKRTEQIYNKCQTESNIWEQRGQLALAQGDDNLASEAFERQKSFTTQMLTLKTTLIQQTNKVETFKHYLIRLETKVAQATTEKYVYQTKKNVVKAKKQLQETIDNMDTRNAIKILDVTKEFLRELENIKNNLNDEN